MFLLIQGGMKYFIKAPAPAATPGQANTVAPGGSGAAVSIPAWENRPHQLDPGAEVVPPRPGGALAPTSIHGVAAPEGPRNEACPAIRRGKFRFSHLTWR